MTGPQLLLSLTRADLIELLKTPSAKRNSHCIIPRCHYKEYTKTFGKILPWGRFHIDFCFRSFEREHVLSPRRGFVYPNLQGYFQELLKLQCSTQFHLNGLWINSLNCTGYFGTQYNIATSIILFNHLFIYFFIFFFIFLFNYVSII